MGCGRAHAESRLVLLIC